jgi:hypothetical protein
VNPAGSRYCDQPPLSRLEARPLSGPDPATRDARSCREVHRSCRLMARARRARRTRVSRNARDDGHYLDAAGSGRSRSASGSPWATPRSWRDGRASRGRRVHRRHADQPMAAPRTRPGHHRHRRVRQLPCSSSTGPPPSATGGSPRSKTAGHRPSEPGQPRPNLLAAGAAAQASSSHSARPASGAGRTLGSCRWERTRARAIAGRTGPSISV